MRGRMPAFARPGVYVQISQHPDIRESRISGLFAWLNLNLSQIET
jgi:hypothetical protein